MEYKRCESRCDCTKIYALLLEQDELLKCDQGPALLTVSLLLRADAYPIHLAINSHRFGLGADTANSNNCIEVKSSVLPHAVPYPKTSVLIGVALVGPLINKGSHGCGSL